MLAYTIAGWVPCILKRTSWRKKQEGKPREVRSYRVQLLPAKNVVKRWPEQVKMEEKSSV